MGNVDNRLITRHESGMNGHIDMDSEKFTELSLQEAPTTHQKASVLRKDHSPSPSPSTSQNRHRSRSREYSRSRPGSDIPSQISQEPKSSLENRNGNEQAGKMNRNGSRDSSHTRSSSDESISTGEPVSRVELLNIVRKHAHIVPRKRTVSFADEVSEAREVVEMEPRYWKEMFDLFYVSGRRYANRIGRPRMVGESAEDFLYFVRDNNESSIPSITEEGPAPIPEEEFLFCRPWDIKLRAVVGDDAAVIDWKRSFFLNLICQTVYTLTVAVCSRKALEAHKVDVKNPPPVVPIQRTTRRVYATPIDSIFDANHLKAQGSKPRTPSYPSISFSVGDPSDTFQPVDLTDADHCLCVLLNAHSGAAFPEEEDPESGSSSPVFRFRKKGKARVLEELTGEIPKVTLFSGFVSYPMVKGNFSNGVMGGLGFWSTTDTNQSERLIMKGPGGRGEADVTVSYFSSKVSDPTPSLSHSGPQAATRQRSRSCEPRQRESPTLLSDLQMKLIRIQEELTRLVEDQRANGRSTPGDSRDAQVAYQSKFSYLNQKLQLVQQKLQDLQSGDRRTFDDGEVLYYEDEEDVNSHPAAAVGAAGGIAEFMRRAIAPINATAPLTCSLRSLSMPWEALAHDLLFKSIPMKVDITGHIFPRLPDLKLS